MNKKKTISTNFVIYNAGCKNACFFCSNEPKPRGNLKQNLELEIRKIEELAKLFKIENVEC